MPPENTSKAQSAFIDRLRTSVRGYMLRGILILVPLGVTAYVLALCYQLTAGHLAPFIRQHAVPMPDIAVAVLSLVLFVSLLYLIGLAAALMVGKRLIGLGESILRRIPLVKTVYAATKQVVDVLSVQGEGATYQAAVLVPFPSPEMWAVGFITGKMHIEGEGDFFRVFVSTTPNPTSGYFEILPASMVQETGLSVEDAVKLLMSAGILAPAQLHLANLPADAAKRLPKDTPPPKEFEKAPRPAPTIAERTKHLLQTRLLSGFLVLVPIGVTVFITGFIYNLTAGRFTPLAGMITGPLPDYVDVFVSIALLLLLLYVTGYVATAVLGGRLIHLAELIISRIPLVTTVYGATKQIMESFVQKDGGSKLKTPVVVPFPYHGARAIGFLVGDITTPAGRRFLKVYVPTTPNITLGLLEFYEPEDVFACGMTVEEAVKMVVSGGIIGPESITLGPLSADAIANE
jgi:uncharacterized membrane protein